MSIEGYIRDHVRAAKQELQEWAAQKVREALANLLISTTIARANDSDAAPLVHTVNLWGTSDGQTASNAEDGEIARPEARSTEMPGHATGIRDDDPCIVVGLGANLLVIPLADTRWRPKGIRQSETAIYNLAEAAKQGVIKIDKDGAISIKAAANQKVTIDAGAGADVQVNGGSLKVARKTDNVDMGTWSVKTAVIGAVTVVTEIDWVEPGGAAPIPLVNAGTALTGEISGPCADRFKG